MSGERVTVIGGGLVGCLQAVYLAQRHYEVVLYESRPDIRLETQTAGKSINLALSHRGREALAAVGLEDAVLKTGVPVYGRAVHDLHGNITTQLYSDDANKFNYSIDRSKLNILLLDEAEKAGVKIKFGHKLTNADFRKGSLTFSRLGESQAVEVVVEVVGETPVFGCDGSYSATRQHMLRCDRFNLEQKNIEHGYKELHMPATKDGKFAMPFENYLHIWARSDFMLMALPNSDYSYTITLFMPFSEFDKIQTPEHLHTFFSSNFPDSVPLLEDLEDTFFASRAHSLSFIKVAPHHYDGRVLLMGDAAHATVPFYAQGMNSGFEDCLIFSECLREAGGDLDVAIVVYSDLRVPDANTICDLSMYNYYEMRHLVATRAYKWRKRLDGWLHTLLGDRWLPLYAMVTYTRLPYTEITRRRDQQDAAIATGKRASALTGALLLSLVMWRSRHSLYHLGSRALTALVQRS